MTLTPEQVGILFTVVTGLLIALTNYLTRQATKTDIAAVHEKVDQIHQTMVKGPKLVDGHTTSAGSTVTWETPAKPKA